MNYRIVEKDAFAIVGLMKRVKLIYEGVNPEIAAMWQSLDEATIATLKALSNVEPKGMISASTNFSEGRLEGDELDHYIGVATTKAAPDNLARLEVPPYTWAVFESVGPFPETLELWDRLLAERPPVVAIGTSDVHAGTHHLGPLTRVVFPYEYTFRCVNTHVLLEAPLSGDLASDRSLVYGALQKGHAFVGYDLLGPTRGFRFGAQVDGGQGIMGDQVRVSGSATLEVEVPMPARISLLRDGQVVARTRGVEMSYRTTQAGVYRVEVHRRRWGRQRAWIFSNPVYLVSEGVEP